MPMSVSEREHVSLLRRHAHAAGSLAQAMADAVSPLALSKSLQVAVQSFGVCIEALRTLAATTETVELDTNKARLPPLLLLLLLLLRAASLHGSCLDFITACCATYQQGSPARASPPPLWVQIQMLARKRIDVVAPDPDTPRLLPSVHLAWAPLVGALQVRCLCCVATAFTRTGRHHWVCMHHVFRCPQHPTAVCRLQDWRVSVIEAALQFLADAACLAGGALPVPGSCQLSRGAAVTPSAVRAPEGFSTCMHALCAGLFCRFLSAQAFYG